MVPELRPRGIGEMLDAAVALYRGRARQLITVAAFVVVPVQIFNTIVLLSAQPTGYSVGLTGALTPTYDSGSAAAQLAARVITLITPLFASAFIAATTARIVADAYSNQPDAGRTALRVAFRRLFAIIGVSVLVALSEGIGLLGCGIGVLAPLTWFAVATPALILERTGVGAALGRSFNLTKSHFFRVLGLVLSVSILAATISGGLAVAVDIFLHQGGSAGGAVVAQGLANAIASSLSTPFVATAIVVCYFDLRIRDEGFDVQLMMQAVDSRHAGASVAAPPIAS